MPFTFSNPQAKRKQVVDLEQSDVNMDEVVREELDETQTDPNGFFADTKNAAACSVRVALRVRPLIGRELYESPNICITCYPESNQLIIGKDRNFTFDKIFDIGTRQQDVFDTCVKNLVLGCFSGYNATVLAYGQTGSGKTHTMGSGYTIGLKSDELGIIPRVIKLIFEEVDKRKLKAEFIIKCTFLEIYNEELHDLLDHGVLSSGMSSITGSVSSSVVMDRFMQKKEITIREEKNGNISVYGLREEKVTCYEELAACLDRGSNFRSTASTLMNNCSSRSHAIFTISIEQHIIEDLYKADGVQQPVAEGSNEEFMVAKFHFVDLAGSERAKRTGATGATLKEGISINKGLLALGNVISALTEEGKKGHVPYRDSKLTRILQDSLGGNSRTSMIACVSPAEINFEETLNTLKYASRARNIKNKPIVNRDPNSAQIAQLRQQVYELQRELVTCRKLLTSNNIEFEQSAVIIGDFSSDQPKDSHTRQFTLGAQEISKLEQEIKELKVEKSQKEKKLQQFLLEKQSTVEQLQSTQLEFFTVQKERDISRYQLEQIVSVLKKKGIYDDVVGDLRQQDQMEIEGESCDIETGVGILEEYRQKVEEQKQEIAEKQQQVRMMQRDCEQMVGQAQEDMKLLESKEKEIERLKRSVNKMQKESIQIRNDNRKGVKPIISSAQKQEQQKKVGGMVNSNKKKGNVVLQDSSNNQWLSNELDYNIKHFNELFIENLSQSLSTMLVAKKGQVQQKEEEDKQNDSSSSSSSEEDQPIDDDIQSKQEPLEISDENKQQDEEMKQNLDHQEQQIIYLEGDLKDKEGLLDAIKESHKMLQNNLLEAMKMEYHKKITCLDVEMRSLEKERSESIKKADGQVMKNKVDEGYRKKLKELEDQLKEVKKKDSEQTVMMKESGRQKDKIKLLEVEIDKMKFQKVSLMKKMKAESDEHRKWKNERGMELIKAKQANQKKDREIATLKRENQRKDVLAKRKQEELSALQKKNKNEKQKMMNAEKQRHKKKNIDISKIQEWIICNTDKMLKFKELRQCLMQEEQVCKEVEDLIGEEQGQMAKLNVRKEKLELRRNVMISEDEIYYANEEIEQLQLEIKAFEDNIESLEEKQDFVLSKINNLNSELIGLSPDDVEQLRFEEVQSIEGARACLGAFFQILLDVNVYKKQLEQQVNMYETTIETMRLQLEELSGIQRSNECSFQRELEQINREYREKEELMMRIIMENGGIDMDVGEERQGTEMLRQYLKSKENESGEQTNNVLQNVVKKQNGKAEVVKKSKEQVINQSKMALSKRVAELERKNKDEEKRFENMRHKFEQTNQEKELYKRQLDIMKQKVRTQEIQEVKNSKIGQSDEIVGSQNAKSPKQIVQTQQQDKQGKLIVLNDMRKERKMKKLGAPTQKSNEPKVIADEPMEDEDLDQLVIDQPYQRRGTEVFGKNFHHQLSESVQMKVDETGNVFSRLSQGMKRQQTVIQGSNSLNTSQNVMVAQNNEGQNGFDDDHKWKCVLSKEGAHNGQICALASVGNQLYSTSNKSLKIWDLDTMTCVSDIQAHSGFIKCMAIWESKNLLLTASEKVIMLWDMISLTNVGVMKGHKDEIRAMNVSIDGNTLFSAGKGSSNGGALLLWDLRKGAVPIEEKEKSQDIFSLASTKDHLFFGCRNHQVYPMSLSNYEILHPQEPPHFDVVTSLSILDNTLVSGSKDKNLRCWDLSNLQNKYSDVMQAHSDWINAMETDSDNKEMYSGGKDGVVKVWKVKKRKLKCTAALSSNSGAINCLSKIEKSFGKMFALGSSDKSIRMWKFKEKYMNDVSNSPDQIGQDEEFFQKQEDLEQRQSDIQMEEEEEEENQEIENSIFGQMEQKEEYKQKQDMYTQKYQPVRQAVQSIGGSGYSSITTLNNHPSQKLEQMRRQKRLAQNKQKQQKENETFTEK